MPTRLPFSFPCIVVPSWLCAQGLPESCRASFAPWFPPGCALKASQTAVELPLHRGSLLAGFALMASQTP
ncbi:hypothetical protein DPMN_168148 [Dreissena polymorpha]|uniref:Uncharacterized protein n=1 Tax=Dreissena polymorpha TaxID=45954 RepID=A0A9D4F4J7_DREPO|nr:hypothetical protein DPMN_168148 [Dreissena polymorpha]